MNTYFYSATTSKCSDGCHYRTCRRRCLSLLDGEPFSQEMKILPGGSGLKTPSSMELRSGDIIILFAENSEDIDNLVSIKDFFDTFRIILIMGEENLVQIGSHYALNPRYTTHLDGNMKQLTAIINRMATRPDGPTDRYYTQEGHHYA